MKILQKTISIIMCFALLFSFFGCVTKEDIEREKEAEKKAAAIGIDEVGYIMPYLRSDSLDPYAAGDAVNRSIAQLIYDSLFSVDNTYKATPLMVQSYTQDDESITVILKKLKFTDGSDVTPADVVFSFEQAKKSDFYSSYLKNISEASVQGNNSVTFSLNSKNIYETANLTFPIVKHTEESSEEKTDVVSNVAPLGSGRYYFDEEKGERILKYNPDRLGGYNPKYNKIGLKDVSETSSIPNLFSLGEIDFYTEDFSGGTYKSYTGTTSKKNTTFFTFLGVNGNKNVLSSGKVRRALALLLNRSDLTNVSFAGFGVETSTPFHPYFYGLKGCTLPSLRYDKDAAIELLTEQGFDKVSENGIRYGKVGSFSLTLVVNSENVFRVSLARSIQQAFAKADIDVNIKEMKFSSYVSAIQSNAFDLYIGEAVISNSFDLSGFFDETGGLSFGISPESPSRSAYNKLEATDITMQEFLDTFSDDLPFIPLAYRQGMTVRSEKIKTDSKTIVSDYFYNISEWAAQ